MKDYWFVPNNIPEKSTFYFIFDEEVDNCICIKDLKEFSNKFPNIKLYKESVEEDIYDLETKKYLEDNFELERLIDISKDIVFKLTKINNKFCFLAFRKGETENCITLEELKEDLKNNKQHHIYEEDLIGLTKEELNNLKKEINIEIKFK